ncbi:MAG: stage III sporulation protein AG [Firmicutes bacterium]|nr:stage III sporulation protein AG [Bacillota bacterium]
MTAARRTLPLRGAASRWAAAALVLGLFGLVLMTTARLLTPPAEGLLPEPGAAAGYAGSSGTAPAPAEAGATVGTAAADPIRQAEAALEAKVRDALEQIDGAGRVAVIVTLDGTERLAYARETEQSRETTEERDSSGGTRKTTQESARDSVVLAQSGGASQPVLSQATMPEIKGVLVVAEGARNPAVRELIAHAVQVALGVPAYRIMVVPGKGK